MEIISENNLIDTTINVSNFNDFTINLSHLISGPSYANFSIKDENNEFILSKTLLVAPGYQLFLKEHEQIKNISTKKISISGKGSHINKLYIPDSDRIRDTTNYYEKDTQSFINYLVNTQNKLNKEIDSLILLDPTDMYNQDWSIMLRLDNKYINAFTFIASYSFNKGLSAEIIHDNLKKIGISDIWTDMNNDNYLKSQGYKYLLKNLNFYVKEGLLRYPDEIRKKYEGRKFTNFHIMNEIFSGGVKSLVMTHNLQTAIYNAFDKNDIDSLIKFNDYITIPKHVNLLNNVANNRLKVINQIQVNKEVAKNISFKNTLTSETVELSNFKGKILFIESWASWCGPCQEEIPHLKKLVEHYKDNPNIQFISLAVNDDKPNQIKTRHKLIEENEMNWLQLEDHNKEFSDYFKILAIPHNVILSKDLKVLDNDSIRPSNPKIIEYLDSLLTR